MISLFGGLCAAAHFFMSFAYRKEIFSHIMY